MEGKEAFIEFLQEVMQDNGMNLESFSAVVGCNPEAVGRWLSGKFSPSPQCLIAIARKFHTSIDYMYGLTDKKELAYTPHSTTFYERYCRLRELRNKNDHQVSVACEFSRSTIYSWKNRIDCPNVDSIRRIAKFLDGSLDYLFGIG